MKIKYILKKTVNIKNSYLVLTFVILIAFIIGCFSYAIFTATSEAKGALNIITGNLYPKIECPDLDQNNSISVPANTVKTIILKLENINTISVKSNLYYSASSNDVTVGYLSDNDMAPNQNGVVLSEYGHEDSSKTITVQIKNDNANSPATVTFGSNVGLSTSALAFPNNKSIINMMNNNNITGIYVYNPNSNDSTYCVTGEEETCITSTCNTGRNENNCASGTIVKYMVKPGDERYFYVVSDSGKLLTLQQRENTLENIPWDDNDLNTSGPATIIEELDTATADWENVKDQTFTLGTTVFKNNYYTGCASYSNCNSNTYTMPEVTMKSRMISVQELAHLGCTTTASSCPLWLYNSTSLTTIGYHTLSASTSSNKSIWYVNNNGALSIGNSSMSSDYGTKAVVVISK